MTETTAFQTTCELLEQLTTMTRAEARGTVRITLKEAGIDPRRATVAAAPSQSRGSSPPPSARRPAPDPRSRRP